VLQFHLISSWRRLLWLAFATATASFGAPRITEFMAANDSGLADEDGDFSDWIEIHNPDNAPTSLAGYHLTDNPTNLGKWTFPAVTLSPGAYLVVFASGKDRLDPAGRLHADFSLSAEGEYLALVAPDGEMVVSVFAPAYSPQFENESFGLGEPESSQAWSYFATPTPGAPNGGGKRAGPIFGTLGNPPAPPAAGPLIMTAQVRAANDPVATVRLYYRRMFAAEIMLPMTDDGAGGDATAGDGVWTAVIPGAAFAPGEMTRWRFVATDGSGTETKEPAFRKPLDSHQYFGTVPQDAGIQSALPALHWFTSSAGGAGTATGSRGAIFFNGEFYDNVLFNLHGQSSSGFPKKSYNIDFNRTQRFLWSTNAPRVADIDLLTNWADKSKVRHVLAYEIMRESGVAAHFAHTVRVEQNGNFFSTADLIEDADEIYLERAGLNPEGALYKVYRNLLNRDAGNTATSGVEKKTRKSENNSDLQALINGLDLTGPALVNYLHDNIDLPRCVNMLAANSVIRNIDMHSKNWYIYRDTGRSGEWAILPWDLDLSHGRVWNEQNTYFDNAIYTDGFVVTGTSIRLVSHLFANPAIRAMILRRIRTLTDRFLQPPPAPGTPENELYYERRLNEQSALIDPPAIVPSDARRDFEKWGSWLHRGGTVSYMNSNAAVETMAEAIQRWKTEYLPARRNYIYNTQIVGKGGQIPLPQTGAAIYNFIPLLTQGTPAKAFVPTNSNLGTRWIGIPSFEPFDTSGWISGVTGVGYERGTGYETLIGANIDTQMRSNNSVYIRVEFDVPNPAAYDRLELRMKFDDGFVAFLNGALLARANAPASLQWNSAATTSHEANPASFETFDVTDKRGSLRSGRNILAIQGLNDGVASSDMIIVPELHGGMAGSAVTAQPVINFGDIEFSPASGNQNEEFVQLLNPHPIGVDISDWRLAGGIDHTFAPGTVLPPGGALHVSPNAAVFRARAVSPKGGEGLFVQGGYQGHLSSVGETLVLIDAAGTTNNSLAYEGRPSDAQRFLVVSELMYHPAGDGLAEFIELLNISDSITLDLRDVRFTRGVEFNFTGGAITTLAPGARVLVTRDLSAFNAAYGTSHPVAGVFTNGSALNNGGESIKLEDAENGTIREFAYGDTAPWPAGADGPGYSLALIGPHSNPDHGVPANWRSSARPGGSPGETDVVPFPASPSADGDGNGERDLIDYALGNDLGLPPILPAFTLEPDVTGGPATLRLICSLSLGAERAELAVFFSADLVTWRDGAPDLETVSMEPLGDGRALVTWRVKPPLRDEPRVFMQLRVTER
jgi:hypothetical protein